MQIPTLLFMLCGILSAKGSPVDTVEPIEAIETLSPIGVDESLEDLLDNSLPESVEVNEINDVKALNETSKTPEEQPVFQATVVVQSASIFQANPIVIDVLRRTGPVELGLRNVVAASSASTEEIYLDMTALNAETSQMINSKSEILTAHAMNDLFEPLNKVEILIRKTDECGKRYEVTLNLIFKDIDVSLKECSKNLTAIDEQYKSNNVGTLTSLSIAAGEMSKLPESCEIEQNFAVGTFCIVNNLAEMNERVLSDVRIIKQNTARTEEDTQKSITATEVCQQNLIQKVTDKLNAMLKEIDEKCVQRKPEA